MKFEDFSERYKRLLDGFCSCYREAVGGDCPILKVFIERLEELQDHPPVFEPYHKKVLYPFDYHQFSLDFIRPLIDLKHSKVHGTSFLKQMDHQLKNKENVVLLANHQTETDPLAIAILLEKDYPDIAKSMIFVAGERVITDPLAIPFSLGCDLLCIFSKRYIDHPPELKHKKQLHNKHTMQQMSQLLKEGGKIIYVAPSGGRDRLGEDGRVKIAPFDPASIEMFHLMAKKSKTNTHFYPLTLATYDLLPPPETIQQELGETRVARRCPIEMAFSEEFDMEHFEGSEEKDKDKRRKNRAELLWSIVNSTYTKISS